MRRIKVPAGFRLLLLTQLAVLIAAGTACNKNSPASVAKAKQERLTWNLKTTAEAYDHAGFTNPAWDEAARQCLEEFGRSRANGISSNEPWAEIISTNAAAAVDAGCNDPMVNYLFIKYSMSQTHSKEEFLAAFCKTAKEMNNSTYPPVRKFYAAARALDQIFYTYGTNSPSSREESEIMPILNQSQNDVLYDKTTPAEEAFEVADLMLSLLRGNANFYDQAYQVVEKPMFKNWPDASTTWLLKGNYYITAAWNARGGGYANSVTKEGWKLFADNLGQAQSALEHAWKLNPKDTRIAEQMMTVILGQSGKRDRMELWFNRAMEADPNDYEACKRKLYYLEPKWYGSDEDQLTFGRECVQSTKWGGSVPLALLDAHTYINGRNEEAAQANYWKRPDVWADVQAALDRFFELNPDATSWYHSYAWYAYHAEQWDKLNELIPKLGSVNYDYFGGKEEFDKMIRLANEHGGSNHLDEKK